MTAFELCSQYDDQKFKLKRGSVIWECITYLEKMDTCRISRLTETTGKGWLFGLKYVSRYISPDTEVEIVEYIQIK